MRSGYTGHVTPSEWRWVIVVSSFLVLLAFMPFMYVVLSGPGESQQFMGTLHNYREGASHLAAITQGAQGEWLSRYLYTPEPHYGVLTHSLYISLGRIAQITSLDPIIIFHVARVFVALFMYMAIYTLAANIWMRVRTRRIFFVIATVGTGFGWLAAPLLRDTNFSDIFPTPLFPLQSTLMNVHFPLVIGVTCVLVSAMIGVLRPGSEENPSVTNAGLVVFIFSLALSLFYLQAFIPLACTFVGLWLLRAWPRRQISGRELRWMLWFIVPALPLTAYFLIINTYNPVVQGIWAQQSAEPLPDLFRFAISLGLPLIIAAPGIYRAVRKFEPDGSQIMFIWLIAMLVMMVLLPGYRYGYGVGLMIPVAYFGARAFEDVWFKYIARTWRVRIFMLLVPLMVASHAIVLFAPVSSNTLNTSRPDSPLFLARDYVVALRWLESQHNIKLPNPEIVLASPMVSVWVPAWTGMQVIYGYPTGTLKPEEKYNAVVEWFTATDSDACAALLDGEFTETESYTVRFVIYGPVERALGDTVCIERLLPTVSFGEVAIYRYARGTTP